MLRNANLKFFFDIYEKKNVIFQDLTPSVRLVQMTIQRTLGIVGITLIAAQAWSMNLDDTFHFMGRERFLSETRKDVEFNSG